MRSERLDYREIMGRSPNDTHDAPAIAKEHVPARGVASQDPSSALVIETIETIDALEAAEEGWDALVLAMPRPSPFLLHGWLTEWWRHFGAGARLTVVVARRDGRLVGVLPAYVRRERGLRVARFLGSHESALADLVARPDEDPETARAVVERFSACGFDFADLFGLPGGSLLAASGGPRVHARVEAPVLLMPDGWDAAYASKTSSKKRNLHRRRLRQLGEVGAVEFAVGRTRAELEPQLEDAFELHTLRWRGRPDGSTFGTAAGREFHRAALRRLADDDRLRIVLMSVGGKPAAFHYFFLLDGTMIVHRLAFDPALAQWSPGLVTTLETLRVASNDGARKVEFLGGGERYKLELADRFEPLHTATGLARNPLGSAAVASRMATMRLRAALKRSERLHRIYLNGLTPLQTLLERRPTGPRTPL